MMFEHIHAEKAYYPLSVLCQTLEVSRSGYYAWLRRPESKRARRQRELTMKIKDSFHESRETYGSPRVSADLRNNKEKVSRKTVAKLMRENGLVARMKRRFKVTTDSRNTKRIAPNVLARDFTVSGPDQVWVTDVTAIPTVIGWLYLAAILDLFSRRVVGWATSRSNNTELALAALRRAIATRCPSPGILHHSDRGSPYGSDDYVKCLERHGFRRSMSRKGDCWDNAVAESFFSSLEMECVRNRVYPDFATGTRNIQSYIEEFYNPQRLHSTIGYLSPIEYELASVFRQDAA